MPMPLKDEVGNRYGRLVVVAFAEVVRRRQYWLCQCDCGNMAKVIGVNLRVGQTKSCGCLQADRVTTHGLSSHPAFLAHRGAKQRCGNPSNSQYANYGGRGIQFKFASFEQFWEELGPTWKEGLTLDRKDNDGHYEPGNCRWVTQKVQMNNQRRSLRVIVNGKEMTAASAAQIVGKSPCQVRKLFHKYGQNIDDWPQHLRS